MIRVRVKYCGGCNPSYDRVALVEALKERLSGRVVLVTDDREIAGVLAVQGCDTACADVSAFEGKPIFFLTDPAQVGGFIDWLEKIDG